MQICIHCIYSLANTYAQLHKDIDNDAFPHDKYGKATGIWIIPLASGFQKKKML